MEGDLYVAYENKKPTSDDLSLQDAVIMAQALLKGPMTEEFLSAPLVKAMLKPLTAGATEFLSFMAATDESVRWPGGLGPRPTQER